MDRPGVVHGLTAHVNSSGVVNPQQSVSSKRVSSGTDDEAATKKKKADQTITPSVTTTQPAATAAVVRSTPSTSSLSSTQVLLASYSEFVQISKCLPKSMELITLYRVQNANIRQQYEKCSGVAREGGKRSAPGDTCQGAARAKKRQNKKLRKILRPSRAAKAVATPLSRWHMPTYGFRKKIDMQTAAGGRRVDERQLYHGTIMEAAYEICENTFDPKKCKTCAFGKGSYFSTSAAYSHRFAVSSTIIDDEAIHYMLISSVLVGRYAQGQPHYTAPPPLDVVTESSSEAQQLAASGPVSELGVGDQNDVRRFDSCVENIRYPQIFVVFDAKQCCPEYVLEYKTKA